MTAPVTAALVAAVDAGPADTVLDLAGGTGDVAEALADRVDRVISSDLSPVMVEFARSRGLPNAEHRVLDMQAIDLPDESVDAVVSRFGYMLVPDAGLALRETRRVLRPGGRLAFATWAEAARNPWATVYGPVLIDRGLMEPLPPGEPGMFALGIPEAIVALVRSAGFDEVSVREVHVEYRFEHWDGYRRLITGLSPGLRETLAELPDGVRDELDEAARAGIESFRTDEGYVLPGAALVTSAV